MGKKGYYDEVEDYPGDSGYTWVLDEGGIPEEDWCGPRYEEEEEKTERSWLDDVLSYDYDSCDSYEDESYSRSCYDDDDEDEDGDEDEDADDDDFDYAYYYGSDTQKSDEDEDDDDDEDDDEDLYYYGDDTKKCDDEYDSDGGESTDDSVDLNSTIRFNVSFSFGDDSATPKEGVWKYFSNEIFYVWHFEPALIEHFPELEEDYDPENCHVDLDKIIAETYEIDKDRAVRYLKWLWETFPKEVFADEKDDINRERYSFKSRAGVIRELICNNHGDEYLYNLLKEPYVLRAAFYDCVHAKHIYYFAQYYMDVMLDHNDVAMIKEVYRAYLDGQKGRYSANDLGKLWLDIANHIARSEMDDCKQKEVIEELIPLVKEIGVRGEKALKKFDETLQSIEEELKHMRECEETEKAFNEFTHKMNDECKCEEKTRSNNTAENASTANFAPADKHEYITIDATKLQEMREERRKFYEANRPSVDDTSIHNVCRVAIDDQLRSALYYKVGDLDLSVGDRVVVPYGKNNDELQGTIVQVGKTYAFMLPCKTESIKTVLRKI